MHKNLLLILALSLLIPAGPAQADDVDDSIASIAGIYRGWSDSAGGVISVQRADGSKAVIRTPKDEAQKSFGSLEASGEHVLVSADVLDNGTMTFRFASTETSIQKATGHEKSGGAFAKAGGTYTLHTTSATGRVVLSNATKMGFVLAEMETLTAKGGRCRWSGLCTDDGGELMCLTPETWSRFEAEGGLESDRTVRIRKNGTGIEVKHEYKDEKHPYCVNSSLLGTYAKQK